MITANCPSCGGTIKITLQTSKMAVCPFCGQTSYINAGSLTMIGQKNLLVDYGSMFKIGRRGKIQGMEFQVIGRLRIDYEDGFFDEWYLNTPNGQVWLSEDEGEFVLFNKSQKITYPFVYPFKQLQVGTYNDYEKTSLYIIEKSEARVNGGEGELPFQVVPGEQVNFIDAIREQQLYSFEILPREVELHIGNYVDVNEIFVQP